MFTRRLAIAGCLAMIGGFGFFRSAPAQSASQVKTCVDGLGGKGLAYKFCVFQYLKDWSVAFDGATYKVTDVGSDNVGLTFVKASDSRGNRDDVTIPYSAIRRIDHVKATKQWSISLLSDK